jgi:hypothetical protein
MIKNHFNIIRDIRRIAVMILLFDFFGLSVYGQSDSLVYDTIPGQLKEKNTVIDTGDTLIIEDGDKIQIIGDIEMTHSPHKAMIFSLFVPGLGQAYNKKYWKIPFVYGIMGGAGYWVYFNTQNYRRVNLAYIDNQSEDNLYYLKAWRRNLELSYIVMVGTHALQVLDAYVDAYLFYWDVSPDLSLRIEPSFEPVYMPGTAPMGNYGFRAKLNF